MKRWLPIVAAGVLGFGLGLFAPHGPGFVWGDEDPPAAADPVVYWELACNDAEQSVAFFEDVFGWKTAKVPDSTLYHVYSRGEEHGINGGIFTMNRPKLPWLTVYVHVDDVEAKAKEIEEKGGFVTVPPQEFIPGAKVCVFNDPSGVAFAMLERRKTE